MSRYEEEFRRSLLLITADSDTHHVPALISHRQFEDPLGLLHSKMTRGVKNPEK